MKKLLLLISIALLSQITFSQDSLNMTLKYNWNDTSLYYNTYWNANSHNPKMRQYFNEIWGWHNPVDDREYAVIGVADGTYIFDVSNTDSCYVSDYIPGKDRADIHRDFKTYGNYLYGVADEGNGSLQIIDMSTLPNSATLVYDNDSLVRQSHNIFIDNGVLYMVSPKTPNGNISGLRMLDIATNPTNPTIIADFSLPIGHGTHVHDLYVRDNIAYCSNGTAGFYIYDVSNPNNVLTLNSIATYDEQGYNHNSWLSDDGNTLFFADETHGMGIKSYDISDINNISLNTIFRSHVGAIPHNHFVKGDSLYVSYYHDGVYVFNIEDPKCPYVTAYYDTYEEKHGYYSYQGAWGVYPYLPSGTILGSDFENGLFVIELENTTPVTRPVSCENTDNIDELEKISIEVYPNPSKDNITITIPNHLKGNLKIYNSNGQLMRNELINNSSLQIDVSSFPKGIYCINFETNDKVIVKKFVKE